MKRSFSRDERTRVCTVNILMFRSSPDIAYQNATWILDLDEADINGFKMDIMADMENMRLLIPGSTAQYPSAAERLYFQGIKALLSCLQTENKP